MRSRAGTRTPEGAPLERGPRGVGVRLEPRGLRSRETLQPAGRKAAAASVVAPVIVAMAILVAIVAAMAAQRRARRRHRGPCSASYDGADRTADNRASDRADGCAFGLSLSGAGARGIHASKMTNSFLIASSSRIFRAPNASRSETSSRTQFQTRGGDQRFRPAPILFCPRRRKSAKARIRGAGRQKRE